jgi:segregation and condensation protein A
MAGSVKGRTGRTQSIPSDRIIHGLTDSKSQSTALDTGPGAALAAPVEGTEEGEFLAENLPDDALRLKLEQFEGPFEVLLYLIRSQEIDIFDIPIFKITEQYLELIELMHGQDLDIAGDFLVMAATLIQIKSRMLLPADIGEEEEEIEEEDPRLELVEKLLEYRKFRDLGKVLGDLEEARSDVFTRNVKPKIEAADDEEELFEVSLYDLIRAVRAILKFLTEGPIHHVEGEVASVDEKIAHISGLLAERESVTWADLFRDCRSRIEMVCCLLAILELCRMGLIRAHQHHTFGDIRIFPRQPESGPSEPGSEPAHVAVS